MPWPQLRREDRRKTQYCAARSPHRSGFQPRDRCWVQTMVVLAIPVKPPPAMTTVSRFAEAGRVARSRALEVARQHAVSNRLSTYGVNNCYGDQLPPPHRHDRTLKAKAARPGLGRHTIAFIVLASIASATMGSDAL